MEVLELGSQIQVFSQLINLAVGASPSDYLTTP